MVPHLKHIRLQVRAAVHKIPLRIGFHVAGEQEAGGAVVHPQYDGGIVGLAVLGHRAQHGDSGAAQLPDGAHGGDFHRKALLLGVLDEIPETLGGRLGHRAVHMVCREVG